MLEISAMLTSHYYGILKEVSQSSIIGAKARDLAVRRDNNGAFLCLFIRSYMLCAVKLKYKKKHALSEEDVRRVIWEKNVHHVSQHNLEADFGLHKYRLEINVFSDKTVDELNVYRKCFNGKSQRAGNQSSQFYENPCSRNCDLPPFVDWRIKGFVTPVKDQGDCGSCWAFSSTGALEAQNKAKNDVLISLSEQNLVDCSWKQGNSGCDGGWMENAFQYVIDNRGIDTEKAYPYIGVSSHCKFKRSDIGANCTKYIKIRHSSEKDLQSAVANIGPVSVAIDASSYDFMFYKEGIYVDHMCSKKDLNHAVLVVGYGTENGTDYWIVKNSWGTSWGLDGYILMARNSKNQCGIASHALYPLI